MFVLKFDDQAKGVMMTALDILARQIGSDLSKAGGAAAAEAAMKLIGVHNLAAAVTAAPKEEPEVVQAELNDD